nr:helicase associated domain-containing protein [uncultured Caldimonas sp.]
MKNYQRLVAYAKEHGHALPPRSFVSGDGFKLGIWAAEQRRRRQYHDAREVAALEALPGWVWDARDWRQTRA